MSAPLDERRATHSRGARRGRASRTATPSATSTAADLSFHEPHRPDLVVYPSSTADVSHVLAIANERRIPVTPFGVGTSLEGHVIPVHGGISLDLSRLDRIVDVSPANLTATVQAGVTRLR